jgi:hypothetical protein
MNNIQTYIENKPYHRKSSSMTNCATVKEQKTETIDHTRNRDQKTKSLIYNRSYVLKPKSLNKEKKERIELYPINYLPTVPLNSPRSTVYNSSRHLTKNLQEDIIKKEHQQSNIYKKVFDKKYEEMSRYNKYQNTNELFLIHPEKYVIPVKKESGLENKLKQIKSKVAFIKSIYDYSYPIVIMEKMKSLKELKTLKEEGKHTVSVPHLHIPIEHDRNKRKSVQFKNYLETNRRREGVITLSVPPILESSHNNYRVFKLLNA